MQDGELLQMAVCVKTANRTVFENVMWPDVLPNSLSFLEM